MIAPLFYIDKKITHYMIDFSVKICIIILYYFKEAIP